MKGRFLIFVITKSRANALVQVMNDPSEERTSRKNPGCRVERTVDIFENKKKMDVSSS